MFGRILLFLFALRMCCAGSDLQSLYENHEWFKLREAVRATAAAPAFYRGAVAAAFHDVKQAETYLRRAMRSAPGSAQAEEARKLLWNVYFRAGRYRTAFAHSKKAEADSSLFALLARYPDQAVVRRASSRIKTTGAGVPLSIDGKAAAYIFDTGANLSLMSESEAARLGLTVHDSGDMMADATGRGVGFRVAVADRVVIGNVHLRNVAFLVFPNDRQPFVELPETQRGVVGLPVILALEGVRWSAGVLETGFRPEKNKTPNLYFSGAMPFTEAAFGEHRIVFQFDTGAEETDLWPRFGKDFAGMVNRVGKKQTKRVTGVGNSVELDAMLLPEVKLRVGGFDTVLRPATVLLQPDSTADQHGNLGSDLLAQAGRVTIDFRSMTLTLE